MFDKCNEAAISGWEENGVPPLFWVVDEASLCRELEGDRKEADPTRVLFGRLSPNVGVWDLETLSRGFCSTIGDARGSVPSITSQNVRRRMAPIWRLGAPLCR